MRFMHIADVHLGYQQYGLKERFNDFSKVFLHLTEEAIAQKVDFVLLAGDLFEKRTVEPLAMRVAIAGLTNLRDAHIPVLAVEGNHEKAYYREQTSWMDFLDALDYLKLLNPRFEEGRAILEPHGPDGGAYVDLPDGVRVYGLRYYGASTGRVVQALAHALEEAPSDDVRYTIAMMHAGLEGQLPHVGKLKLSDVALLRDHVDYVALGHIHKPYVVEDWIYNPGSPETCGMDEEAWPQRGYVLAEIMPGNEPPHKAEILAPPSPPRRPFHRFPLKVDALMDPNAVYDAVRRLIRREDTAISRDPQPVIELSLVGTLPFDRYDLDLTYLESLIHEAWKPLMVRVRNATTPAEFDIQFGEQSSRPELERAVIQDLLERDARYRDHAEAWTAGALELKRLVLESSAPEAIIQHLERLRVELAAEQEAAEA